MLASQQQQMQQNPPLNPNIFHQQMAAALQVSFVEEKYQTFHL